MTEGNVIPYSQTPRGGDGGEAMSDYSYEKTGNNFCVRDADDNRIATCWDESNAAFIAARLNQLATLRERVEAQDVLLRRVVAAFCLPSDSLAVPVTPDEVSKVVRDVMAAIAQPPAGGAT